ncbi:MAG: hypothetical protein HQM09_14835 [Candidatus Riflebacteria bacterium]|nr:hypothetical protein [Candidatus Riflebacteria bacterium]
MTFNKSLVVLTVFGLLLFTGCAFWGDQDGAIGGIPVIPTQNGSSNVAFKIVLPEATNGINPSIRATTTGTDPTVTFKLWIVNVGNPDNPYTILTKTVTTTSGDASVEFPAIPSQTIIGEVQIDNGTIGGRSDFHGGLDLITGNNTLELSPKGSGMKADIIATVLKEIVKSRDLIQNAPQRLAMAIDSANNNLPPGSSESLYSDVLNQLTISRFSQSALTQVTISNDGQTLTATGLSTWTTTITKVASGTDFRSSTGLKFYRVVRQGIGPNVWVIFGSIDKSKWGLVRLASVGGAVQAICLLDGWAGAVLVHDGEVVAGGQSNGYPVVFQWSAKSNAHISNSTSAIDGKIWYFDSQMAQDNTGKSKVEFVDIIGTLGTGQSYILAMARESTTGLLKRFIIDYNTGAILETAPKLALAPWLKPGDGQVLVVWDTIPGSITYKVYWGGSQKVSPTNSSGSVAVTLPSFLHSGLTNDIPYWYIVTWINVQGVEASPSLPLQGIPHAPVPAQGTATVMVGGSIRNIPPVLQNLLGQQTGTVSTAHDFSGLMVKVFDDNVLVATGSVSATGSFLLPQVPISFKAVLHFVPIASAPFKLMYRIGLLDQDKSGLLVNATTTVRQFVREEAWNHFGKTLAEGDFESQAGQYFTDQALADFGAAVQTSSGTADPTFQKTVRQAAQLLRGSLNAVILDTNRFIALAHEAAGTIRGIGEVLADSFRKSDGTLDSTLLTADIATSTSQRLFNNRQAFIASATHDLPTGIAGSITGTMVRLAYSNHGKACLVGDVNFQADPNNLNGGIVVTPGTNGVRWNGKDLQMTANGSIQGNALIFSVDATLALANDSLIVSFSGSVAPGLASMTLNGTGKFRAVGEAWSDYAFALQNVAWNYGDRYPCSGVIILGDPPKFKIEFSATTPDTGSITLTTDGKVTQTTLMDSESGYEDSPDLFDYTGTWQTSRSRGNPSRYVEMWRLQQVGSYSLAQSDQDAITSITVSGTASATARTTTLLSEMSQLYAQYAQTGSIPVGIGVTPALLASAQSTLGQLNSVFTSFQTISGGYFYMDKNFPRWFTIGVLYGKANGPRFLGFYKEATFKLITSNFTVTEPYNQVGVLDLNILPNGQCDIKAFPLAPASNSAGLVLPWTETCLKGYNSGGAIFLPSVPAQP